MSIKSHLSTFFSFSGVTGLFMTQGSMMISFHFALRTLQVPCPSHVKLTSAFSAIRDSSFLRVRGRSDLKTEKAIFPQRQQEDSDCCDSPQVREDQVARLAVETEQANAEDPEGQLPPPLDLSLIHISEPTR